MWWWQGTHQDKRENQYGHGKPDKHKCRGEREGFAGEGGVVRAPLSWVRPGGGDSAGPRTPTPPPPPPRGLRPTVSCQRYEPKEPTGAEGAPAPKAPNGVM